MASLCELQAVAPAAPTGILPGVSHLCVIVAFQFPPTLTVNLFIVSSSSYHWGFYSCVLWFFYMFSRVFVSLGIYDHFWGDFVLAVLIELMVEFTFGAYFEV